MMRKLAYLIMIIPLVTPISCAKKPESIDPFTLLGLSEKEVISKLGEPDIKGTVREGLKEFMYQDIHFNVSLENGTVTACLIRDASSVSLNDRIRCGVPITDVMQMYGAYTSEEEVADGMTSDQYAQGVLYHRWLSPDTERYSLRYPSKQLLFNFYPDRSLHSVWIGEIY
jgi:hypothetical protein